MINDIARYVSLIFFLKRWGSLFFIYICIVFKFVLIIFHYPLLVDDQYNLLKYVFNLARPDRENHEHNVTTIIVQGNNKGRYMHLCSSLDRDMRIKSKSYNKESQMT
jgi:hypothetical protein